MIEKSAEASLHGAVRMAVFIHAQLLHRGDAGMLKLAGELRLVEEADKVVGRITVEHHLHCHGVLDGGVLRINDRAHAVLRDDFADVVFFFAQEFLRQQRAS